MKNFPDLKQIKTWVQDFRRDVIRMMRLRFILTAMAILIVVFIIMLTSINMIMQTVSQSQSMQLLEQIAASERYNTLDNQPPGGMNEDMPPEKPNGTDPPPDMPQDMTVQDGAAVSTAHFTNAANIVRLDDTGGDAQDWGQDWGNAWGNAQDWGNAWGNAQDWGNAWGNAQDWNNNWGNYDWGSYDWGTYDWGVSGWGNPQQPQEQQPQQQQPQEQQPQDPQPQQPQQQNPGRGNWGDWGNWGNWGEQGGRWPQQDPQKPSENEPPEEQHRPDDGAEPVPPESGEQPESTEKPAETEQPKQPAQTNPPQTQAPRTPETAAPETETETDPTDPVTQPPTRENTPEPREPRPDRWNVLVTIDHFAIMADADGNYLGLRNTEDYTDEQAQTILAGILASGKEKGMYGWLQYCRAEKGYGTLLVITDKTSDQGLLNNLFRLTVAVGIFMLLVLLVILIFLSKKITDPVQSAFTRQKQFVSDAGHELKTPIAVLTANADVLQDEIGENRWLGYMQEQIGRMDQLVGDLLRLARMDNATQEYTFEDFDLSMAVASTTLPFESAAFEQHRNLEMDVQPGVIYHGSEQHIRQLCAIFIDNAIKYSNENGMIKVTLLKRGDHCILEFYNTGCEISQSETERIFERFYRGDKARNNKGKSGYGLGLAIAKSIMDVHRIRFQVTCEQGRWIRFLLTM
ncbi:MAG: hypothetical protein J5851_09325 [Oscillospiraceae bacterium]|nr:hypothetical protein [Oscillospiraceae bacterium]